MVYLAAIVAGRGVAIVIDTGAQTELGRVGRLGRLDEIISNKKLLDLKLLEMARILAVTASLKPKFPDLIKQTAGIFAKI